MNVNDIILKITGMMQIEKELALGQEVYITLKGAVVKQETEDNQDGTVRQIFKVKATDVEVKQNAY